jgi:hypothetical protein
MDLSEYAESLRQELVGITRFAGEDITRAAEMLAESLDSSVRLALLDVLSAAAGEITSRLEGAVVDVRLSGMEPEFVVTVSADAEEETPVEAPAADAGKPEGTRRGGCGRQWPVRELLARPCRQPRTRGAIEPRSQAARLGRQTLQRVRPQLAPELLPPNSPAHRRAQP